MMADLYEAAARARSAEEAAVEMRLWRREGCEDSRDSREA